MQRWKFNSRVQLENESISVYVAALYQLSEFCEYGDTLDSMLCDRLICEVRDKKIQRKLLSELALTFSQALKLAMAMESAEKDTLYLRGTQESTVLYSQSDTVIDKSTGRRPQTLICYRCGGNHLALLRATQHDVESSSTYIITRTHLPLIVNYVCVNVVVLSM